MCGSKLVKRSFLFKILSYVSYPQVTPFVIHTQLSFLLNFLVIVDKAEHFQSLSLIFIVAAPSLSLILRFWTFNNNYTIYSGSAE